MPVLCCLWNEGALERDAVTGGGAGTADSSSTSSAAVGRVDGSVAKQLCMMATNTAGHSSGTLREAKQEEPSTRGGRVGSETGGC